MEAIKARSAEVRYELGGEREWITGKKESDRKRAVVECNGVNLNKGHERRTN